MENKEDFVNQMIEQSIQGIMEARRLLLEEIDKRIDEKIERALKKERAKQTK